MRCCPSPAPTHPTNQKHLQQLSSASPAIGFSWAITTLRKLRRPAAQSLARSSSVEVEGLGLRLDQHSGGTSAAGQRDASGCDSSGSMEATGELVRKPLVQWAVQLETYGAGRFTPHHVGAQPGKSILKERWATGMDLGSDLGGPLSVPKSAVITHPKPAAPVTGVKRSRMAAFR